MFSPRKRLLSLTALLLAMVLSACGSVAQTHAPTGLPPAPPVGTDAGQTNAAVHFVTGGEGIPFSSQPIAWDDGREVVAIATAQVDPNDLEAVRFPSVESVVTAAAFLSLPGEERKRDAWKAWGDSTPLEPGKGAWFPTVTPYKLLYGNGSDAKRTGGSFSLGFAYLAEGDPDIVAVYFNTIYVAPISGDFTFSIPTV